jgi:hypothetical protein
MAKRAEVPDWETLLAHAAALQAKIPSAILVGGTAAAVHSRHRFSIDHDHVVANLSKNYHTAIRALETISGWRTNRRVKGKMVLGSVDGIAAGLRNLRRSVPLETIEVSVRGGRIRLPTVGETLRIKTFLLEWLYRGRRLKSIYLERPLLRQEEAGQNRTGTIRTK